MALTSKQKKFIRKNYQNIPLGKLAEKIQANPKEAETYFNSLPPAISSRQKHIFIILTLLLPVLFFVILEINLQIFNYRGNLDLFIPASGEYTKYKMCNPLVGRRYFFTQPNIPNPPNDLFLKVKPEKGYRIFVLGGSTAAGYPYGDNLMFSRILNRRLTETFPDRNIEVVNTSTTAINSYTLLDFTDEILENEADAILIYAGHNEFYGAMGVASTETLGKFRGIVKVFLKLERYRTFLLIRDFIVQIRKGISKIFSDGTMHDPSATLMERLVAEQTITYGSDIYELGKIQFKENLKDIITKAQEAGVQVLLSELISNVCDQKPFISVKTGTHPSAHSIYKLAQNYEKQEEYEEAKRNYYRAKDLDALRFRATEDFNKIIYTVAKEFGIPVVPMKEYFEAASPNRLIGNNLMLEHLHPNIDGYFLMAEAFFKTMQKNRFISSEWNLSKYEYNIYDRPAYGVTKLDSIYGDLRIRILKGGWPFRPKSLPNRALIDYNPSTKVESLAVKIWTKDNINLERAHVQLAEHYEKSMQHRHAFEEYNALMCLTPYNASPYLRAANALIKLHDFRNALPILFQSLKFEDSAFANKWIGQILLQDNRVKESMPYLEKSYKIKSFDPQLLYNLSGAYALNGQYEKARVILNKLYQIVPNFSDADNLKQQLERVLKNK